MTNGCELGRWALNDRSARVLEHPGWVSNTVREPMENSNSGLQEGSDRSLIEETSQFSQVRSRNAEDEGQPLRQATRDVVGNLVGIWRLTLRKLKPEYVGLLVEAINYLHAHGDKYAMQFGGARNFGAGIVDAEVVNPLYSDGELRRVYNRAQDATSGMDTKDDVWRDQCREAFVRALHPRTAARDGNVLMPGGESA